MSKSKQLVERLFNSAGITVNGNKPFDIQVHDERLYKRILADRELGFGESYMEGWWSSQRMDETVSKLLAVNARDAIKPSPAAAKTVIVAALTNPQKKR